LRLQAATGPEVLERYTFYSVDLPRMASELAAVAPAPPLSMNARLLAAARGHSQDMLSNAYQGHEGSDGSTEVARVEAEGYQWSAVGENVFAFAHSVEEGHAGFEVDWGGDASTGGMQEPPGHRLNVHDPDFREIGVGVVQGTNG